MQYLSNLSYPFIWIEPISIVVLKLSVSLS